MSSPFPRYRHFFGEGPKLWNTVCECGQVLWAQAVESWTEAGAPRQNLIACGVKAWTGTMRDAIELVRHQHDDSCYFSPRCGECSGCALHEIYGKALASEAALAKLDAGPGDLVIATVADRMAPVSDFAALRDSLSSRLPGVHVLLLTDDVSFSVLPPPPATLAVTHSASVNAGDVSRLHEWLGALGYETVAIIEGIRVEKAPE